MNINISHKWLQEYLDVKLTPQKIAQNLALSGPSIERVISQDDDVVYDVEVTTNRPDVLSIIGFCREAAAILGLEFNEPFQEQKITKKLAALKKAIKKTDKKLSIEIKDRDLCRRYIGVLVEGVCVKESPLWLQKRLLSAGQRPINNIVDITNYVMLEYGQPMHAFDSDLLSNRTKKTKKIVVRRASKDEKMITLEDEEKTLSKDMLVISDESSAIAIAGVKGGQAASITSKTKTIILEAASFDPVSVRRTSRSLLLKTDASDRFERTLSPNLTLPAMLRALDLISQLAGGEVVDYNDQYPNKEKKITVKLKWDKLDKYLGVKLEKNRALKNLKTLGFEVKSNVRELSALVPFWRTSDVTIWQDLIEEIGRIYGYYNLGVSDLTGALPKADNELIKSFYWEDRVKDFFVDKGFCECFSYSFVNGQILKLADFDLESSIKIYNPLSADFEYMRPSLLPSILQSLLDNEQKNDRLEFFELAKKYQSFDDKKLPNENYSLVAAILEKNKDEKLFSELKGVIDQLLQLCLAGKYYAVKFEALEQESVFWSKSQTAVIKYNDQKLGFLGVPNSKILSNFGFKKNLVICEIDWMALLPLINTEKNYQPLAKFPAVLRDVAFIINKSVTYAEIVEFIENFNTLINSVELFDVFRDAKIGKDNHSLAFHINYQSKEKTLQTEEVEVIHQQLLKSLIEKFAVQLR